MKLIPFLAAALGVLTLNSSLALAEYRGDNRHRHGPSYQGPSYQDRGYQGRGYQRQSYNGPSYYPQRGGYVDRGRWGYAQPIDYRHHHLRPPPRGYEWRSYDGSWILAALATGLIAEILINGR